MPSPEQLKERIEAAVKRKVEGQEISVSPEPERGTAQVIDLMAALRESLNKAPARKAAEPAATAKEAKSANEERASHRKPARRASPEHRKTRKTG